MAILLGVVESTFEKGFKQAPKLSLGAELCISEKGSKGTARVSFGF